VPQGKRGDTIEVLLSGLTFPEAPRWHGGKLWFSDFYTHRVMALAGRDRAETIIEVKARPSGLGWRRNGTLLIVSMLDRRLLAFDGKALSVVAELAPFATGPCNDMVVDAADRAYIGNFGFDRHAGEAPRSASLICVDPDGSVHRVADDLMFPNGMVISPNGRVLVVAETYSHRLTAFDIGSDGSLVNRRLFATLPDCFPDGICLDADGAIWVADAHSNRVIRVLDGGRIVSTIATERTVFACMLGGADRRQLFLCTRTGSGPAMAEKRDGRIEVVPVDVPGAGLP
jgi:sugar lactone lactonase YvrE